MTKKDEPKKEEPKIQESVDWRNWETDKSQYLLVIGYIRSMETKLLNGQLISIDIYQLCVNFLYFKCRFCKWSNDGRNCKPIDSLFNNNNCDVGYYESHKFCIEDQCDKLIKGCNHFCIGLKNEKCPKQCIHPQCSITFNHTSNDDCSLCDEYKSYKTLKRKACIQLESCHHFVHYQCIKEKIVEGYRKLVKYGNYYTYKDTEDNYEFMKCKVNDCGRTFKHYLFADKLNIIYLMWNETRNGRLFVNDDNYCDIHGSRDNMIWKCCYCCRIATKYNHQTQRYECDYFVPINISDSKIIVTTSSCTDDIDEYLSAYHCKNEDDCLLKMKHPLNGTQNFCFCYLCYLKRMNQ